MFKNLITRIKNLLFPEQVEILPFISNDANKPKSHPKYWQPCYPNGKYCPPQIPGLVPVKELYRDKSTAELKKIHKNCKDKNTRQAIWKILKERYEQEKQKNSAK